MRAAAAVAAALLTAATPAAASPVRLGAGPNGLLALAAHEGVAYAVIGSADRERPFTLVESSGRDVRVVAGFGVARSEFPDVAVADDGRVGVLWARTSAGGEQYGAQVAPEAAPADPQAGPVEQLGDGTGPARLALDPAPVIAFPDLVGDAALTDSDAGYRTLTSDGPYLRHLPLDLAVGPDGPLVLDLVQRRRWSALRVLGQGAPGAPVVTIARLDELDSTLAVDGDRLYVAYLRGGRAWLAAAALAPNATWSRRRLPGPGAGDGAPAVVRTRGRTYVAFAQGGRRRGVFLSTLGAGTATTRRLTIDRLHDTRPFAAAAGDGTVFVGWTRYGHSPANATAYLVRTP
jgi:hypothetical protein